MLGKTAMVSGQLPAIQKFVGNFEAISNLNEIVCPSWNDATSNRLILGMWMEDIGNELTDGDNWFSSLLYHTSRKHVSGRAGARYY